jgi:hypothetical protein
MDTKETSSALPLSGPWGDSYSEEETEQLSGGKVSPKNFLDAIKQTWKRDIPLANETVNAGINKVEDFHKQAENWVKEKTGVNQIGLPGFPFSMSPLGTKVGLGPRGKPLVEAGPWDIARYLADRPLDVPIGMMTGGAGNALAKGTMALTKMPLVAKTIAGLGGLSTGEVLTGISERLGLSEKEDEGSANIRRLVDLLSPFPSKLKVNRSEVSAFDAARAQREAESAVKKIGGTPEGKARARGISELSEKARIDPKASKFTPDTWKSIGEPDILGEFPGLTPDQVTQVRMLMTEGATPNSAPYINPLDLGGSIEEMRGAIGGSLEIDNFHPRRSNGVLGKKIGEVTDELNLGQMARTNLDKVTESVSEYGDIILPTKLTGEEIEGGVISANDLLNHVSKAEKELGSNLVNKNRSSGKVERTVTDEIRTSIYEEKIRPLVKQLLESTKKEIEAIHPTSSVSPILGPAGTPIGGQGEALAQAKKKVLEARQNALKEIEEVYAHGKPIKKTTLSDPNSLASDLFTGLAQRSRYYIGDVADSATSWGKFIKNWANVGNPDSAKEIAKVVHTMFNDLKYDMAKTIDPIKAERLNRDSKLYWAISDVLPQLERSYLERSTSSLSSKQKIPYLGKPLNTLRSLWDPMLVGQKAPGELALRGAFSNALESGKIPSPLMGTLDARASDELFPWIKRGLSGGVAKMAYAPGTAGSRSFQSLAGGSLPYAIGRSTMRGLGEDKLEASEDNFLYHKDLWLSKLPPELQEVAKAGIENPEPEIRNKTFWEMYQQSPSSFSDFDTSQLDRGMVGDMVVNPAAKAEEYLKITKDIFVGKIKATSAYSMAKKLVNENRISK